MLSSVDGNGLPARSGGRRSPWVVLVACTATMVAAVVDAQTAGKEYTKGFAPSWVTMLAVVSGAFAVLAAQGWLRGRRAPRQVVLAAGWFGCVLLLWTAGGVVLDALRALAVLGVPGLPPVVDWPGFVTRSLAFGTAALLARTVLAYQRTSRGGCPRCGRDPASPAQTRAWLGYAVGVLAVPYPLLKVYWALGGTIAATAIAGTSVEGFPIGEIVGFSVVALVGLALTAPWGRIVPRWALLPAGWVPTGALVTMGALAGFGSLAQALKIVEGPARVDDGGWIVTVVYGSWLLLGLTLGGATLAYQQRTRGRCGQCGQ
jgi:hypothetical protein